MELAGSGYLYNLSVLALTYAAVSALVMLLRQTMGGKLSNFDIYLIASYVSFGFAVAVAALLPPLISLFDPPVAYLWAAASAIAAVMIAINLTAMVSRRWKASRAPLPPAVLASYAVFGIAIALLVVNAVVPAIQGAGLFATALTLCLASVMWAFVRRITSLLGEKPGEDWDPQRG